MVMQRKPMAKILVVDDTPSKLVALESVLAPLGQPIVKAGSGREALRVLLKEDFSLILLDVKMADMDGFETASLIRQRKVSEHTPIIFLTAFEQAELDMARGYSLGAVDFIFSPIVPEVLRAKASVFVDLYQKTEEIRGLYSAAEASSRSKSEFLNMAAHELRTPLSVVSGYLAMLNEGSLGLAPAAWKLPLDMLVSKTGELNRIVDDLLLASRMDVGWLPEKMSVLDLRDAVHDARMRAEPRAQLLQAELVVEERSDPVLVKADPVHLGRILDNLINNALTYCSARPQVTIALDAGEEASVEVRDNGVGIPEDKREAVFERFVRLDDSSVGPVPGTGLGLFISRELARRHGGSLELVDSTPGDGSVFELRLPTAKVETPAPAKRAANGRPRLHLHEPEGSPTQAGDTGDAGGHVIGF